jgi:hypothetical protein
MVKLKRIFTAWIDQTVDCMSGGWRPVSSPLTGSNMNANFLHATWMFPVSAYHPR